MSASFSALPQELQVKIFSLAISGTSSALQRRSKTPNNEFTLGASSKSILVTRLLNISRATTHSVQLALEDTQRTIEKEIESHTRAFMLQFPRTPWHVDKCATSFEDYINLYSNPSRDAIYNLREEKTDLSIAAVKAMLQLIIYRLG